MNEPVTFQSLSEAQTEHFATALAAKTSPGSTLCLIGDLGAGKTVFARGYARGLGISGPVTSPTFTLVNTYEGRMPDGSRRTLHHFDLYRLIDAEELHDIGWEEYFDDEAICLVEWPDRAGTLLPAHRFLVEIQRCTNGECEPAEEPDCRIIRVHREGEA